MKWFKWLRRPKQPEPYTRVKDSTVLTVALGTGAPDRAAARSEVVTHPLTTLVEPRDALLRFARDYLVASGARVRVEDIDVLTATLADGRHLRYTTSPARARNEEYSELLVQGGATLAELLDECANRSRVVALRLWETGDPLSIARSALSAPLPTCLECSLAPMGRVDEANETEFLRPHCERCPWREGKTILEGFGPITGSQIQQRFASRTIELTFHMVSTDRSGRHDEWKRVAFDLATRHEVALLSLESVLRMETDNDLIIDMAGSDALEEALTHGQALLSPGANALAGFLRLRDAEDYQRRAHDISTTYDRLLRESSEERDIIHDAFQRELVRLADTYSVGVDVQVDSIAIITSQVAEVALRDKAGKVVTVDVDLGRACMLPLCCDVCGRVVEIGRCCRRGHVMCAACMIAQPVAQTTEECPICAEVNSGAPAPARGRFIPVPATKRSGALSLGGRLQIDDLDAMTPETWHLFITWLLERMGYTSQRSELGETSSRFFGELDGRQFAGTALRLPRGVAAGTFEVQNAAAIRAGDPELITLLLTTAPATIEAAAMAERLGVSVLDRPSLVAWLERLEAAHTLEVAAEVQAAAERAAHAETTRAHLLAELDLLEGALSRAVNTRKAGSRTALLEAVETISSAKTVCTQALLAWETLATDWNTSFGEHEGRDGSLLITADLAAFDEIGERARHLGTVTQQVLEQFQNTPGTGELGYTAWRKAVLEEMVTRCDAIRSRISAISPTAWHDFREARDIERLQQAEEAATVATYARGRADKALAQLQTRARIAVTKS